ncbi:MAG: SpoIIE family protein phosphatase [Candidatus Zixiibacteriota bacterium]|nr:MAG: SpoIIE family protein phosphatase [candidate division Zixibacteria bacterium]
MPKPNKKKVVKASAHELLQNKPFKYQLNLKDRALASSAEGITIADATIQGFPLIYVNRGFEKLTGYSADYACGTNCRFLQGKDTDPLAVEEIRRALKEKRECVVEILNYRKNGEPFWNRLSITPIINNAGVVTHFVGIQSDVTARRKAEDALRISNAKLEHANNLIRSDLQLAAEIQKSFLPPRYPQFRDVKVAWELLSCDELAGDTLNAAILDGRHIAFYVLDVSGHGVQAALLSVTLNRWLSAGSAHLETFNNAKNNEEKYVMSPLEVLERLNRQFPFDPKVRQYFTIIYGVFDTENKEFSFACAGHPSPIFVPKGRRPAIIQSNNFPIGVVPEPEFKENKVKMRPGDRMYLYSDGLVDTINSSGEEFGNQRFLHELTAGGKSSLEASIPAIINRLREWSGKEKFQDDISLLGFEIK